MEIIEFDLNIRKMIEQNILGSIKKTTAILLICIVIFIASFVIYQQNPYLLVVLAFLKGLSFSGTFLAYFHLKILYIDYKVEKKHIAALNLNHTLILQDKIDLLETTK